MSPAALLLAWGRGETAAFDQLVPLVHDELRRLARRYMRHERPGHTLRAMALVNQAHLRLIEVKVVELRFSGGLSIDETGEALAVSPDTVKRDWRFAKLWLLRELSGARPDGH